MASIWSRPQCVKLSSPGELQCTSSKVWTIYFIWGFQYLFHSAQNILPIRWKRWLLYNVDILWASVHLKYTFYICTLKKHLSAQTECRQWYRAYIAHWNIIQRKIKAPPFGIQRPTGDSPHKGPIMQKAFLWHNAIMKVLNHLPHLGGRLWCWS